MSTVPPPSQTLDNEAVVASFTFDAEEYMLSHKMHIRQARSSVLTRFGYLYTAFAALFFGFTVYEGAPDFEVFISLVLALGVLLGRNVVQSWIARRRWQKVARVLTAYQITYRFEPHEFVFQKASGDTKIPWPTVARVYETPRGFLVYPHWRLYYWVPLCAFENAPDIERACRYMQTGAKRFCVLPV